MRSLSLTVLLFVSFTTLGQKTYEFDYLLEYDFYWDHRTTKPAKYIYLTNSLDNAYTAVLTEKDSVTLKLDFLDHNGNHSINYISKDQFTRSNGIQVKCNDVKPHSNTKKSLIKRFDFVILNDTLANGNQLGHYALVSKKNNGSAVEHYIVDKSLEKHLPILRYATAYGKWESTKNLPNGIISERYLMNRNRKKRHRLSLRKYYSTVKAISIPEDCDYSK